MDPSRTTITLAEPLAGHWLRLTFADGAVHEVDLADLLQAGGVFGAIRDDRDVFEAVTVDREFGTIVWPGMSILISICFAATNRKRPEQRYRDESSSRPSTTATRRSCRVTSRCPNGTLAR